MDIKLKRAYEAPDLTDGIRILVERLWPRGLSKGRAQIDIWLKDVAPSTELRRWFNHDPARWSQFKTRYYAELMKNQEIVNTLLQRSQAENICLVYGSKEERLNSAAALKEFLFSQTPQQQR